MASPLLRRRPKLCATPSASCCLFYPRRSPACLPAQGHSKHARQTVTPRWHSATALLLAGCAASLLWVAGAARDRDDDLRGELESGGQESRAAGEPGATTHWFRLDGQRLLGQLPPRASSNTTLNVTVLVNLSTKQQASAVHRHCASHDDEKPCPHRPNVHSTEVNVTIALGLPSNITGVGAPGAAQGDNSLQSTTRIATPSETGPAPGGAVQSTGEHDQPSNNGVEEPFDGFSPSAKPIFVHTTPGGVLTKVTASTTASTTTASAGAGATETLPAGAQSKTPIDSSAAGTTASTTTASDGGEATETLPEGSENGTPIDSNVASTTALPTTASAGAKSTETLPEGSQSKTPIDPSAASTTALPARASDGGEATETLPEGLQNKTPIDSSIANTTASTTTASAGAGATETLPADSQNKTPIDSSDANTTTSTTTASAGTGATETLPQGSENGTPIDSSAASTTALPTTASVGAGATETLPEGSQNKTPIDPSAASTTALPATASDGGEATETLPEGSQNKPPIDSSIASTTASTTMASAGAKSTETLPEGSQNKTPIDSSAASTTALPTTASAGAGATETLPEDSQNKTPIDPSDANTTASTTTASAGTGATETLPEGSQNKTPIDSSIASTTALPTTASVSAGARGTLPEGSQNKTPIDSNIASTTASPTTASVGAEATETLQGSQNKTPIDSGIASTTASTTTASAGDDSTETLPLDSGKIAGFKSPSPSPDKHHDEINHTAEAVGGAAEPWFCFIQDPPPEKPELSRDEDLRLQLGWLLEMIVAMLLIWILRALRNKLTRGVKQAQRGAVASPAEPPAVAAFLYKAFAGPGWVTAVIDSATILLAVGNITLFACATEAAVNPTSLTWTVQVHDRFEVVSILALGAAVLGRAIAAPADPRWRRHGPGAWWRYLTRDVYVYCDVAAVAFSSFGFIWCESVHVNFVWLCAARAVDMLDRREQGIRLSRMTAGIRQEKRMMRSIFALGGVLWVLTSGLFYYVNEANKEAKWDVFKDPEGWQRFESVPSSMFYVLINLCKKNPLASQGVYNKATERFLVVLTNICCVPLFALCTSTLGSACCRFCVSAARTQEVVDEEEEDFVAGPPQVRRWLTGKPYAVAVGVLGFGSVFSYFFTTAGYVPKGVLALIDGSVGLIFLLEWSARILWSPSGYSISPLGWIDFLAAGPGVVHGLFFFLGVDVVGFGVRFFALARIFKLERYFQSFEEMSKALHKHSQLLASTTVIVLQVWMLISTLLYITEHVNPDKTVQDNYSSVARSLWAEAININGEWIFADFTVRGKGLMALVALFSVGVCVVPLMVFSGGYFSQMYEDAPELPELVKEMKATRWQVQCRPAGPGLPQRAYDLLYAHYKQSEGQMPSRAFRIFRVFSVFFSLVACIVSVIRTEEDIFDWFDGKGHLYSFKWGLYTIDVLTMLFCSVEFALRLMALGLRNHLTSLLGGMELLSLAAIAWCLTHGRESLHNMMEGRVFFGLFRAVSVILFFRLLRLFCIESYCGTLRTLYNVAKIYHWQLLRSGFALTSVWLVHASLLYCFERESAVKKNKEIYYSSIPSALQYSMVHLTGDFPIFDYTLPAKVVLIVGTALGMCTIATFTGIFSCGFVNYLASEREAQIKAIAERRMLTTIRVVLRIQREFRKSRQQHGPQSTWPRRRVRFTEAPVDAGSLQEQVVPRDWQRQARKILHQRTDRGKLLMRIAHLALIINVLNTLIITVIGGVERDDQPARAEHHLHSSIWTTEITQLVEVFCTAIFVVEFCIRVVACDFKKSLWHPMRFFDLFCLFPGLLFVLAYILRKLNGPHLLAHKKIELFLLLRVLRVLDLPIFRREVVIVFRALEEAAALLVVPSFLALHVWMVTANLFMSSERTYEGPPSKMQTMPKALYWTSHFLIGEWALWEFNWSWLCMVTCLFGQMIFAIPLGIITEAVQTALVLEFVEQAPLHELSGVCAEATGEGEGVAEPEEEEDEDEEEAEEEEEEEDDDEAAGDRASPRGEAEQKPTQASTKVVALRDLRMRAAVRGMLAARDTAARVAAARASPSS